MQLTLHIKKYIGLYLLTLLNLPILYTMGMWVVNSILGIMTARKTTIDTSMDYYSGGLASTDLIANVFLLMLMLGIFILAVLRQKWALWLNIGFCFLIYGAVLYSLYIK